MKLAIPDIPNDPGDPPDWLCRADELGFLLSPADVSPEKFRSGIEGMRQELRLGLPAGEPELPPDAAELPPGIRESAERIVFDLYGIRPCWVPAYLSTRETGHFSAGVTAIYLADQGQWAPVIFLSGAFRTKTRHRGYDAAETLAHEMVHAVRTVFPSDSAYDEFFPCQVHKSRFRRVAGNFFRKWYIPVLFFCGLTFSALRPEFLILPLLVLLRELQLSARIRSAAAKLRELGLRPLPVLLRLSDSEIKSLARGKLPACLSDSGSLRRILFFRRFRLQ
ncbi:MAG: hypothetical protein J6W70_00120 [Lentisphaeria bacterium]|nr:hypothetical protein [Lentisphaeria bacterium]